MGAIMETGKLLLIIAILSSFLSLPAARAEMTYPTYPNYSTTMTTPMTMPVAAPVGPPKEWLDVLRRWESGDTIGEDLAKIFSSFVMSVTLDDWKKFLSMNGYPKSAEFASWSRRSHRGEERAA